MRYPGNMQNAQSGYALALLSDLHKREPVLAEKLARRRRAAETVRSQLEEELSQAEARAVVQRDIELRMRQCREKIHGLNAMLPTLYREIEIFRRQRTTYFARMRAAISPEEQIEFRSAAAKADAQSKAHEEELAGIGVKVNTLHEELKAHEKSHQEVIDARNVASGSIRKLRTKWPAPEELTELFDVRMGIAHCEWALEGSVDVWRSHVKAANALSEELNTGFVRGFYAPEVHSDVVGGRHWISSESVFAAVACGDIPYAKTLFTGAARADMAFDHIFHIYRLWTLGLYLENRHDELLRMLRRHRYSTGVRGAYTQAWAGLLAGDSARFSEAVSEIIDEEWRTWSSSGSARALGVVCVPATALIYLAKERGLVVSVTSSRVIS